MVVTDLYSSRQRRLQEEQLDVLTYDALPDPLRVQIVHILRDTLGNEAQYKNSRYIKVTAAYVYIVRTLCREHGLFKLQTANDYNYDTKSSANDLFNFILNSLNVEHVLDAVELAFKLVNTSTRDYCYLERSEYDNYADEAIEELNARFMQHGVGYRFEANEIIRISSELIHTEVIKPALALLHDPLFKGAEVEFLIAHEHYRHGRNKEALADCLKSLESTIKVIAVKRSWELDPKMNVKQLLDLMFEKCLVPEFWASHFSGIRSILESGVPTARNRLGGHGQGAEVVSVPEHIVSYALHQTAAAIVFLVSAEKALA